MAVWAAHEETELPIGANFAGYRIEGIAGAGRMGIVYRATHPGLGRVVALKLIARELSDSYAFRQRFKAEAQRAAAIGLVAQSGAPLIYERGESAGRLFLVMRYVPGTDLAALVAREGGLEPRRAVAIVADLAGTLDAAHRRGIAHGDLRPGHVLVPDDPHAPACLIDFGLTPPDRRSAHAPDAASDIHALGAVLLYARTGRSSGPVPMGADIPPALAVAIGRAMKSTPTDRYASAGELARAAAAALPEAAAAKPAERRPRRLPRRALAAAAAAALLAAVLAATGGLGGSGHGARSAASSERAAPVERAAAAPATRARAHVVATIPVGRRADGIAFADGAIWVAAPGDDQLVRVDARTDRVTGRVAAGADPDSVAVDGGVAWITSRGDGHVRRFDAGLHAAGATAVGAKPEGVALGGDRAWVVSSVDDTVRRVDRATGATIGRAIPVGRQPIDVSLGPSGLWTANSADATVTHVDPRAGRADRSVRVGRQPKGIAEGFGSVWVADNGDDTVTRIDARTSRTIATIRVGDQPSKLVAAAGLVWVTNFGDGTVTRIDPRTSRVVGAPIRVGERPVGIAFGAGHLWVASLGGGTVAKIRP
jgi:serine/threonine-protein kinase